MTRIKRVVIHARTVNALYPCLASIPQTKWWQTGPLINARNRDSLKSKTDHLGCLLNTDLALLFSRLGSCIGHGSYKASVSKLDDGEHSTATTGVGSYTGRRTSYSQSIGIIVIYWENFLVCKSFRTALEVQVRGRTAYIAFLFFL